jgi:hypothetical protein
MSAESDKANKKAWRLKQIANGRCQCCGQPHGEDGTNRLCRLHADAAAGYVRKHRAKMRRWDVFKGKGRHRVNKGETGK